MPSRILYVGDNVTLTIDGGNYICGEEAGTDYMFACLTIAGDSGSSIVINGGNFQMNSLGVISVRAMFSNFIQSRVQTTINGGTFGAADGAYVFLVNEPYQTIEDALENVTISGGTFGNNTLYCYNAVSEGPKAYLTADGSESELSTGVTASFKKCTSLRLTDDVVLCQEKVQIRRELFLGILCCRIFLLLLV